METSVAPGTRQRRSDARRNIESILDAAGRLLAEDPGASMQDIAEAAGVHRATVHRHFASKDDLMRAVRSEALDTFLNALEEHAALKGDPGEILRRTTERALRDGDRYRVWRYTPSFDDLSDARGEAFMLASIAILQPAQAAGAVRPDLSLEQCLMLWGGCLLVAGPQIAIGAMTVEHATDFVVAAVAPSGP